MTWLLGLGLLFLGLVLFFLAQVELVAAGIDTVALARDPHVPRHGYRTKGVYRLRHPLYISYMLMIAGFGTLCLGSGGAILALAAYPHFTHRIAHEEALRKAYESHAGRR